MSMRTHNYYPKSVLIYSSPRKKFYLNLRNRFLNLISSIQSKNTFRTNISLFDFNRSRFYYFLNNKIILLRLLI